MKKLNIFWFRRDLRIQDHIALAQATKGGNFVAIYLNDDQEYGAASKWYLHHSLVSLQESLKTLGVTLLYSQHQSIDFFQQLADASIEANVYYNHVLEPKHIHNDNLLIENLAHSTLSFHGYNENYLTHPTQILKKDKTSYKVYTAFWRACTEQGVQIPPVTRISKVESAEYNHIPEELLCNLKDLQLLPNHSWAEKLHRHWKPGETQAIKQSKAFLSSRINAYNSQRDIPSVEGTSSLSPAFHFGEVSIKHLYHKAAQLCEKHLEKKHENVQFLKELYWREFSSYILFHFPKITNQPFADKFKSFPYQEDQELINKWQRGQTGYPIVDAGMRELWETGFMHNRVRMIVASFLTKHLLQDWRQGAKWFWDTLVDADLAANSQNWQWVAGCGVDAAPYFRIFNPEIQSKKFDPQTVYIKKWVPELRHLAPKDIHSLISKQQENLSYSKPVVEHKEARVTALELYKSLGK